MELGFIFLGTGCLGKNLARVVCLLLFESRAESKYFRRWALDFICGVGLVYKRVELDLYIGLHGHGPKA